MAIDNQNPYDVYTNQPVDNLRKFSDELLQKFKGKMVELYIGDQCETLSFEQFSTPQNCSIYGKLIDVLDRFVMLDCFYVDKKSKEVKSGCIVYINAFQIRVMSELNSEGSLNDVFLNIKDADRVRKMATK